MDTGVVEKIVNGGWGLIRSPEGVVLLPYVLPGEEVEYRIKDKAKGILWGEMLSILSPSDERIDPPCPYYGKCGGCILQHMSYENQLKLKEQLFRDDLKKLAHYEPEDLIVTGSEPFAYRVRAKLKSEEDGKIGFIRKSTNTVFPIKKCLLFKPEMEDFINRWNSLEKPPRYHQVDLLLNTDTGQLYASLSHKPDYKQLKQLFPDVVFTTRGCDREDGAISEISIDRFKYRFAPSVFFQNNSGMWQKMLSSVEESLYKCSSAIDLYCGVGFFTPLLSEYADKVVGIESAKLSIELAAESFPSTKFHRKPVEKLNLPSADVLLCDPPRSGLSPHVHSEIVKNRYSSIQYISCNSQTFCRDLGKLIKGGYRVNRLEIMDLFPQSAHFEIICSLSL